MGGEECKPDLERVIAFERKGLDAAQKLFDAIDGYLDSNNDRHSETAEAILGGLHREIKRRNQNIALAIAKQEKLSEAE